eukprot:1478382-Ditylum_brightwellii.AAC.1
MQSILPLGEIDAITNPNLVLKCVAVFLHCYAKMTELGKSFQKQIDSLSNSAWFFTYARKKDLYHYSLSSPA